MRATSENLWALIENTKSVHAHERRLSIQSIDAIGTLEDMKASVRLGLTIEELCESIGVSVSRYWKRARVFRLFKNFPAARLMYERGETELSSLAIIAGKVSAKNADDLLAAMKGKSKREVEALAARVRADGSMGEDEGSFQVVLKLNKEEFEMFNRARQVIASRGKNPDNKTVFAEMAKALLERKDPMKKAERAAARAKKKTGETVVPGTEKTEASRPPQKNGRTAISAAMKHAVHLRDEGQCTYKGKSGARCSERSMLELDHILMVCRGGKNSIENLRLRCKYHNNATAEIELGAHYHR